MSHTHNRDALRLFLCYLNVSYFHFLKRNSSVFVIAWGRCYVIFFLLYGLGWSVEKVTRREGPFALCDSTIKSPIQPFL